MGHVSSFLFSGFMGIFVNFHYIKGIFLIRLMAKELVVI